jgi:3-keto-disaccharide hydrolase
MKRLMAGMLVAVTAFGCAQMSSTWDSMTGSGWVTLIDGEKGLDNFNRVGDANWRAESGAVVADKAKTSGFLVTKKSYKDFQLKAEFWADHTTNSGIFMRCADPGKITDKSCYEANIFDQRPDPTYGTGGIVHHGKVASVQKAGGKWNTYDITVKGTQLTVVLNGVQTTTVDHSQFAQGPIALQFGNRPPKGDPGGAIKWRKVQIKEL